MLNKVSITLLLLFVLGACGQGSGYTKEEVNVLVNEAVNEYTQELDVLVEEAMDEYAEGLDTLNVSSEERIIQLELDIFCLALKTSESAEIWLPPQFNNGCGVWERMAGRSYLNGQRQKELYDLMCEYRIKPDLPKDWVDAFGCE